MLVYLDGKFLPADQAQISIWDGGYLHGDGVYTTLRVYAGNPVELPAHWERLTLQARALEIPLDLSLETLGGIVAELVARNGLAEGDGRLRVTVSRGAPPDGSLPLTGLDRIRPTVLVTLVPVPDAIAAWQREGIGAVVLGPAYRRSHFPELKTLNGLTTVLALRQAARAGCREALLTTARGRLLEGAVSNLFLVRDGRLLTPAARGGFLPGLTRRRVLELARGLGTPAREASLYRRDLQEADEVFCASSVREILPVVRIDREPVGAGRPGPVTRTLQAAYRAAMVPPQQA